MWVVTLRAVPFYTGQPVRTAGAHCLPATFVQVVQDRRYVTFMRSYPNLIPLGPVAIYHILKTIEPFAFEQIYGAWWKANVLADAKAAVGRSAERYLRWVST